MKARGSTMMCLLCLQLAACQSQTVEVSPAIADQPDAQALAELEQVVRQATGAERVTVTTDVFSRNHILVVEPKTTGIPNVGFATGRLVEKPHTFHLLSQGSHCMLEHVNTGKRYRLKRFRCR